MMIHKCKIIWNNNFLLFFFNLYTKIYNIYFKIYRFNILFMKYIFY